MEKSYGSRIDYYGWLAIGSIMLFFSWGMIYYLKPIMIETQCSEIASASTLIPSGDSIQLNSEYYTNKSKCISEATSKTAKVF